MQRERKRIWIEKAVTLFAVGSIGLWAYYNAPLHAALWSLAQSTRSTVVSMAQEWLKNATIPEDHWGRKSFFYREQE